MMGFASSRPPLVSPPATATARLPPRRRLYLSATSCASTTASSSSVLSHGGTSAPRSLVAAELQSQSQSRPPPLAAGVSVRGDAATGLAFLLFVLAVVFPPRIGLPTSSCRRLPSDSSHHKFSMNIYYDFLATALKRLEIAVHKLSKVVAEEVPGTLSSLKLSCLEINDLTSQLKNLSWMGLAFAWTVSPRWAGLMWLMDSCTPATLR
uniref:Uncharacterized protein n=1 Tax=Oryza meridionalis TaxID=40149 RepID=A0A0E0DLP1_9ORYZ